jgi:hypothetical protein
MRRAGKQHGRRSTERRITAAGTAVPPLLGSCCCSGPTSKPEGIASAGAMRSLAAPKSKRPSGSAAASASASASSAVKEEKVSPGRRRSVRPQARRITSIFTPRATWIKPGRTDLPQPRRRVKRAAEEVERRGEGCFLERNRSRLLRLNSTRSEIDRTPVTGKWAVVERAPSPRPELAAIASLPRPSPFGMVHPSAKRRRRVQWYGAEWVCESGRR